MEPNNDILKVPFPSTAFSHLEMSQHSAKGGDRIILYYLGPVKDMYLPCPQEGMKRVKKVPFMCGIAPATKGLHQVIRPGGKGWQLGFIK